MSAFEKIQKNWIMTPGPTAVSAQVRQVLSAAYTNPDLDPEFVAFYAQTAKNFDAIIGNTGVTYFLAGEGILGLEAACASFIEPGDRVLTIANGIFGEGFDGFSKMYGGHTVLYQADYERGIDVKALDDFIALNGPFKLATVVYCETPSGITNPIDEIGPLLKSKGILSIVDAVSAIGGEPMAMSEWQLDVVLCASQKAFSAPVGLTTVSLSKDALEVLKRRQSPIAGFYTNLKIWDNYESNQWFPYTQPIELIAAFRAALDAYEGASTIERHKAIATAVRATFMSCGFGLFPKDSWSNTVTTVSLPEGLDFNALQAALIEADAVLIGGGFDFLENRIFRIGHMGEGANVAKLSRLFKALNTAFELCHRPLPNRLDQVFESYLSQQALSAIEKTN